MFSLSKKLSPTITDMIRFDHSHVLVTFHQYTSDKNPKIRKALADTICNALDIHATLEEEIFYPALAQIDGQNDVLQKSPEHQEMRLLIAELRSTDAANSRHGEIVMQLMRDVIHHVADEETVLLAKAEQAFDKDRLSELGVQMTKRRMELVAPKAGKIAKDTVIGFSGSTMAWVAGSAAAVCAIRHLAKPKARTS